MKKMKCISILLCLILLLQTLAMPVLAEEVPTTGATEPLGTGGVMEEPSQATFGTVSIQNGCRTLNGMVPLAGTDRKLDTAQGVFLYEVATDTVVYSYNPDLKIAPGNLAKMVTALIALESCDPSDLVTVNSVNISKLPAGSLNQNLKHDEQLTVESLIYCMFLQNANDAAIALAEHVSGTQQAFVSLMNARVEQMGCTGTEFTNVHGLETVSASHTTARDMAKIVVESVKNEKFKELFSATSYEVPATDRSEARKLTTLNYMMEQSDILDFIDQRVTGGVSSFHTTTGAHLVCTMQSESSDPSRELEYVAVILGATRVYVPNDWRVQTYGNFNEMTDLLNLGFDNYKVNHILYEGMSLSQFTVDGGESNVVGQAMVDYNSVVPISATMDNLTINYFLDDGGLTAPVAKDQLIGTMEIWYRNSCMAEAEVYAMSDVKAADKTGVTIRSTAVRRDSDDSGILSIIGTICVIILGLAAVYLAFNAYMRSRIRAQRRRRREARRRNY